MFSYSAFKQLFISLRILSFSIWMELEMFKANQLANLFSSIVIHTIFHEYQNKNHKINASFVCPGWQKLFQFYKFSYKNPRNAVNNTLRQITNNNKLF